MIKVNKINNLWVPEPQHVMNEYDDYCFRFSDGELIIIWL